ncbi:metallophosphoesterase [Hymenobacter saemangeumensis]|uniref:Metallophosphoesterase n=1 Tax=Hymenobacter saemangeumensis TaxID=1084522 RepID=A0ABP8ISS2_9BACT
MMNKLFGFAYSWHRSGTLRGLQPLILLRPHAAWLTALLLMACPTPRVGAQPIVAVPPPPVVFAIGGTGLAPPGQATAVLAPLLAQARAAGPRSVLLVLGDQLSTLGMPAEHERGRAAAEQALQPLLAAMRDFPGQVVCLPGEAEWHGGGARGWERVRALQAYLGAQLGRDNVLLPGGGCPGPVEIALDSTHTLVVLDTQWWLHAWDKPGEASDCETKDPAAVVVQLDDILARNQGKHLLVAGHHPLYSAGYSVAKAALPNPRNRLLRKSLLAVLDRYPNLTYLGGHEPSLQYLEPRPGLHYVVSGAAATGGGRRPRQYATFAARMPGFARLDYRPADSVRLTLHAATGQVLFRREWAEPTAVGQLPAPSTPISPDSTALVRAGKQYQAGKFKAWLMGQNYRAEWAQPVRVPVLNLGTAHGGLTPLKRGGGLQTKSLRLRGGDGREYVLRSVGKDVDKAVPWFLRQTLAADVVQDQISASHPYAALTVPLLAEAAAVPHTQPRIVLVPDDPRLGPYRRAFAGTLAVFEARDPAPPRSYGGQPQAKAYSTLDVVQQVQGNPQHRVDQRQVLRARLLDMVLADWDRHDDQWRWLAYPRPGGGRLFRAAPRDRDQAYFVNQGLIPRQASAEALLPKFQGFDYDFRNVNSFNFNGRYFDRSFLTGLSEADWLAIADSVQASLTDAVLEQALHQLPDTVFRLSGPTILAKLRAHRDQLPRWAGQYYRFLAREVDVVGTKRAEVFEVERQDDSHTLVKVWARQKKSQPDELLYQRTFRTGETKEIRLFGLGGNDLFRLRGQVGRGPAVRLIGGEGADSVQDASRVRFGPRKTLVYDEPQGIAIASGPETRNLTSPAADVNTYDRQAFQYNYTGLLYPLAFNSDDGLFIGLGMLWRRPGFRKQPWATTQRLTGNVALATGAFNFTYAGHFTRLLGPYDLQVAAEAQAPNYVRNFFGLGNETDFDQERGISYYRARFRNFEVSARLQRRLGTRWSLAAGPVYQAVNVENTPGRFLAGQRDERLRPEALFSIKQYGGGTLGLSYNQRSGPLLLPQGLAWQSQLLVLGATASTARPLTQLTTELALYRSLLFPVQLTLATRFGGTATLSRDYEFFQAATLDGLSTLRGYRRTRFAGRHSAYNNTELRLQAGTFRSYLFTGRYGVLAFHDVGRVWVSGESSSTWHRGYGGGVWLAPFQQLVIAAMYGASREGSLPLVRLGFFF